MARDKRVSVVMATYNGGAFVREQLRSILEQSLTPHEVLVTDDGSTDDTLEVVDAVARTSAVPVRVHRNADRLGFADNFLEAVDRADGDVIAFADQDDRWHRDKLRLGVEALATHDATLATHRVNAIDSGGTLVREVPPGTPDRVIERGEADPWGNFYGFTMMFERSLLASLPAGRRGADPHTAGEPLSHDRWVYFLASTYGRIVEIGRPLADYRQHAGQLYGGQKRRGWRERHATKVERGHQLTVHMAQIAADRASLLDAAPARPSAGGEHLAEQARRWRTRARMLRRSATIYEAVGAPRRLLRFSGNAGRGVYRSSLSGGLGRRRMRDDLAMAVVPRSLTADPDAP